MVPTTTQSKEDQTDIVIVIFVKVGEAEFSDTFCDRSFYCFFRPAPQELDESGQFPHLYFRTTLVPATLSFYECAIAK
jgi:hypothetical protein